MFSVSYRYVYTSIYRYNVYINEEDTENIHMRHVVLFIYKINNLIIQRTCCERLLDIHSKISVKYIYCEYYLPAQAKCKQYRRPSVASHSVIL